MDHLSDRPLLRALKRLGRSALRDRLAAVRALAAVRGLRYVDDRGRARTIDIALKPWLLTTRQLSSFRQDMMLLAGALQRLPSLRRAHPPLRHVLRFDQASEAWLGLAPLRRGRPLGVVGRLDANAIYDRAGWRQFQMLEPNAVGVGGVHYAPAAASVLLDVLADVLAQCVPGRPITATPDPRRLLLMELRAVARRLGGSLRGVALIENTDFTTGTDEFQELARDLRAHGVRAVVADPRDVRARGSGLFARGVRVDLLYRDSELKEFVEMESRGARLTGVREAVRAGRLVSALVWEHDQKSAWEVFTDARYAGHFTPAQRRFFRAHLPWTRLVREATVSGPSGRPVDLPAYVRRNRSRLVLKPNTLFGGVGVVVGAAVSQREWERVLGRAVRGRQRYVVQQRVPIHREIFPLAVNGEPAFVERKTVSGFFVTSGGIGLIGRFSSAPVVNVSQGGGIIPALWVH